MSNEGSEAYGLESYEVLFKQILTDLGVSRLVERFRMVMEPEEPYFMISMRLGKARSAIKVPEVAHLDESPRGTMLTITDESYAPALLSLLWSNYGRDRIDQLTRFEILVKGIGSDELSVLEVDPGEELRRRSSMRSGGSSLKASRSGILSFLTRR